jgi:hypothetical protein
VHEWSWEDISPLSYSLTSKGGELWEKIFKPHWHRYIDSTEEYVSDTQKIVIIKSLCFSNVITEYNFPDSVIKLTKWHPLYWKELDSGYILYGLFQIEEPNMDLSKCIKWHLNWDDSKRPPSTVYHFI